jgi:hypothetical protein
MNDIDWLGELRLRAVKIVVRAEEDADWRRRLQEHPSEVLAENGLSPEDVEQLRNDPRFRSEARPHDCADWTCIVTRCPDTCYVTIWFD